MSDASHHETEVFAAALRLRPDERAAFLAKACGNDRGLHQRLEELLQVHGSVGDFLADPMQDSGVGGLLDLAPGGPRLRIDRYKLIEKIGEGGCGVIYLAEQEEPVRRRVALKIIKPGMGTKDVIARFQLERQALALMDHPGIAKVFDAGETDSGRPYFVMELIRGIKITEYCDRNALPVAERLRLFIQVCEAVQHAHQKGVIHRDLKPSNILVTATPEGAAQPVIIDFGIAKATNELRLTDQTLFTAVEMLIGTPTYMSPEQTGFTSADVDTRSDIYSLGVLLYELLTGTTPFDAGELLQLGIDEVRRAIREQEPPRPSVRLRKMAPEQLAGVALHRCAEPRALVRALQGDLDWIVMKCLEKDRARRYVTANGLALEVKRHLSHEPVDARPPSSAYRFQKAVRRNKLAFGAAAAVMAALLAGTVVSTWQLLQARKAQRETEAARDGERQRLSEAQAAERKAQAQALAARRTAYSSDMNVVEEVLRDNNLGRARLLLKRHVPQSGELDLRDWEWRFLWSQARPDDHEVFVTGPRWSARPLSFSPDGRRLAREFDGSKVAVTGLVADEVVWVRDNARLPVFAHRGNRLAFVTKDPATGHDVITLRDLDTQEETRPVTFDHSTEWIGFTPDDQVMLTVSRRPGTNRNDGNPAELTAWETDTGRMRWHRTIGGRPPWMRWRIYAISPDGTAFAASLASGKVQVFDTKDGRERFTAKATKEISLCVMFSPDSATLLTSAGFSDPLIRLWDARTGEARGIVEGHSAYVTDLLFTPDGSRLVSSGADQTIRLWEWPARKPAGVLRGHLDEVDGLALSPDGQRLASRCKDGAIYLWDLDKPSGYLGYRILPARLKLGSRFVRFTADSRAIVAVESNGNVAVWDTRTLKPTARLGGITANGTSGLSPEARWILTTEQSDGATVWDVATGKERKRFDFKGPAPGLLDWKFVDGGNRLLIVIGPPATAVLEAWDTRTWERVGAVPLHFKSLLDYSVNFEPKSFTLRNSYVVMADGALRFFDATTLEQGARTLQKDFEANDWTGSPDGRVMAAADSSGQVWLWDVATLQLVASLKSFRLGAHSVAFSPDGRRLVAGSNGREAVRLWDVETWQEVLTLPGDGSRFGSLKFSPDGRYLLAVNDAGVAHLWAAPTWEEIATAEAKDDLAAASLPATVGNPAGRPPP
ncbi:MAG: protein kinase [Verrucomicrobia bacterium]|nr:protein kinase [Verrucomicrobiota bacterium]